MLEVARERIAASDVDVDVIQAGVDEVAEHAPGPFDAICCHAVLLYLDDPFAPLDALHDIARPRAILSLLEKNGSALAMRPGIKGDYREALRLLDDPVSSGNLRIANVARPPDGWMRMLQSAGWHLDSWVGIRGFSDFPPDDLSEDAFDDLLRLERESGRREPYRSVARLFHMSARAV
jgi:SAM-dependent methyltransferase